MNYTYSGAIEEIALGVKSKVMVPGAGLEGYEAIWQNANKFKLGLFAFNCSCGPIATTAPEQWTADWDQVQLASRMADEIGLEFLLPVARWKGYGGATDRQGTSFETMTWASATLASTKEIVCFATVHTALISPVFAAKQLATADQVGHGRLGLNVVSGWNYDEFDMFGVPLMEHDSRYVHTEEWLDVAKRIWAEQEPFDFKGQFFDLKGVIGKPKLYRRDRPLLMSAGSSGAGRSFATRNADCLFMAIYDMKTLQGEISALRASAPGKDFGVYASGHMVCRETEKEAREYHHYITHEHGDWEAAEIAIGRRMREGAQQSQTKEQLQQLKERFVSGGGTFPMIGSYDQVAQRYKQLSDAGLTGMAVGLVNYVRELPYVQELLPRMARLGLRVPAPA